MPYTKTGLSHQKVVMDICVLETDAELLGYLECELYPPMQEYARVAAHAITMCNQGHPDQIIGINQNHDEVSAHDIVHDWGLYDWVEKEEGL